MIQYNPVNASVFSRTKWVSACENIGLSRPTWEVETEECEITNSDRVTRYRWYF